MPEYAEIGGSRSGFTTTGLTSVTVLRVNPIRKQVVLVNDSSSTIYLVKGDTPAVVGSGVRLNAGGGSAVIEPDTQGRIWRGAIQAIAGGAGSNLSWSEDW